MEKVEASAALAVGFCFLVVTLIHYWWTEIVRGD